MHGEKIGFVNLRLREGWTGRSWTGSRIRASIALISAFGVTILPPWLSGKASGLNWFRIGYGNTRTDG